MDKCEYEFVIMMKGMKELVKCLVLEVKGTFEEDRRYSIRDYKVSGITVKKQLYPSDEKERYFHIFYNDRKRSSEHEAIEAKIDCMAECLHKHEGTKYEIKGGGFARYFDLIYYNKGKQDEKFMYGRELHDVINEEIRLCGYFVIDEHLYEFCMDNRMYSEYTYQSDPEGDEPSADITLDEVGLCKEQKFALHYDFGDDWMFTITVSKISEVQENFRPRIVKSKGSIQQYPDLDEEDFDDE